MEVLRINVIDLPDVVIFLRMLSQSVHELSVVWSTFLTVAEEGRATSSTHQDGNYILKIEPGEAVASNSRMKVIVAESYWLRFEIEKSLI